ncbi:MAG: glycosyl transferase family 1, partial [Roseiflexaceae bacterium]|nr:glycosyl transferase family 1 [Roseiflexaceae bacterium]
GDVRPLRETPLWDVAAGQTARASSPAASSAQHRVEQRAPAPPPSPLVRTVAGALVELGMTGDDRSVLEAAARALAEIS